MLGEADIDDFRIAEFEPALFQRLVERGGAPGSRSPDSNLHAFEVGERLVAAAVDVVLAHHQRGKAVAWLDGGLVGHDFHENAAPDGIIEAGRHRSAADFELAGAERRDHLCRRIETDERYLQALLAKEAHG